MYRKVGLSVKYFFDLNTYSYLGAILRKFQFKLINLIKIESHEGLVVVNALSA